MARLTSSINIPGHRADLLPLLWWERCCVLLLAAAMVAYGIMLMVAAVQDEPGSGELQSALRAGWAVLAQKSIYDESTVSFTGPPILAVLVSPLAHPPVGEAATGYVPWALAVAVSYFFNCLCLMVAIHWLAGAVEAGSADPLIRNMPAGCLRWWYARVLPVLVLAVPLSASVAPGASHALTLLLIAGMSVNLVRRQPFGAGVWLGGAMSLQVICVFLILIAIWRRDRLMTMGIVLGLGLWMLILPGLIFGLQHTNEMNVRYFELVKQTGMNQILTGLQLTVTLLVWGISIYLLNTMATPVVSAGATQRTTESERPPRKVA